MRRSIFSVAILTALAAVGALAAAQSPTSFPWCMKGAGGGTSCYFHSYQDCRATLSGLGGWCIRNPYYRRGGLNPTGALQSGANQLVGGPHRCPAL
jgi:hypothetical protein